jgi:isoquinoline 1-oxidoreductase subunit beta
MNGNGVSRRFFLTAAVAAGGGLLIGPWLDSELPGAARATPGAAQVPLNAWIRIGPDDVVTLISSQSEMGQGVMTTLPAVLAEELGADWRPRTGRARPRPSAMRSAPY